MQLFKDLQPNKTEQKGEENTYLSEPLLRPNGVDDHGITDARHQS